jgi:hypothetical protein
VPLPSRKRLTKLPARFIEPILRVAVTQLSACRAWGKVRTLRRTRFDLNRARRKPLRAARELPILVTISLAAAADRLGGAPQVIDWIVQNHPSQRTQATGLPGAKAPLAGRHGRGARNLIKRPCSIAREFMAILYWSRPIQGMPRWRSGATRWRAWRLTWRAQLCRLSQLWRPRCGDIGRH